MRCLSHCTTYSLVRLSIHSVALFEYLTNLPSRISMVIERDTTSLEARSLATGAYLSMNLSP